MSSKPIAPHDSPDAARDVERVQTRREGSFCSQYIGTVVLGSFRVLQELGCGAFATAYLAQQLGTDRHAVIKLPHRHLLSSEMGERVRRRFAAELRASTRVTHPNVATVYTSGDTEDGVPAIAMEYVPGKLLASLLKAKAPLHPRMVAQLAFQIASALAAVHAAGIIHRDVTPRNIIASTSTDGRPRYVLLDFGVAKLDGLPSHTLGPLGTPRYMPREQVYGQAVPQSDMFGLGAIMWWALTGQEYLADVDEVASVLVRQVERASALDPRELQPSIPAPVAKIVASLMHPDAQRRPTAQRFLELWPRITRHWGQLLKQERTRRADTERAPASASAGAAALPSGPGGGPAGEPGGHSHTLELSGSHSSEPSASLPLHGDGPAGAAPSSTPRQASLQTIELSGEPQAAVLLVEPDLARTHAVHEVLTQATPGSISGSESGMGSGSGSGMQITVERFAGMMPEWIQDLREAMEHGDMPAITRACYRIGDSARLVGADHLARLSDVLHQLVTNDLVDQALGFVVEIEEEFHRSFREILQLHRIYST